MADEDLIAAARRIRLLALEAPKGSILYVKASILRELRECESSQTTPAESGQSKST